jgi:hypothetical protein
MSNKQQTAVEWLEEQCPRIKTFVAYSILEQAKEMEKEQIIHAYNQSWHFRDKPYETAEKYYNETFGGKL